MVDLTEDSPNDSRPHCGNCRFWLPPEEGEFGECHGSPPSVVVQITPPRISGGKPKQELVSAWPGTIRGDLCGQHVYLPEIQP